MKSPFKFLDPYELKDRESFFGREAETKELYSIITKNRLIFLYGPSGTGKTSLVQCGLANCFERIDWMPIFVRRGDDINTSLRLGLHDALGHDPSFEGNITEAIRELYDEYRRPVYLIFDQFEELFILGDSDEAQERQPFYDTIAEILDAELPCRLLFILREDYFGHLNQFEKTVPELYHRKLRVEPMNHDNLREVVAGSCKVFGIGFDDARRSPELIMDNIVSGKSGIHMPYVQVYLHMLYQEATAGLTTEAAGGPPASLRFTDAVIRKVGPITDVLGKFLQEQKTFIFKTLQQNSAFADVPEDAVSQVLDVFVSAEGTKNPVTYAPTPDGGLTLSGRAAQTLAVLPPALVSAILLDLEKSRILRRSDETLEIAHDSLAALIDQQRSVELRQLRDIRQRIETGCREHADSGGAYFFDKGQLARIEPFLPKLALETEQSVFLEKSRAEAERLERAERERVQRELRLAEEKLAAEERARKRQAVFLRVIAAVAVVAVLASIFAWQKTKEAREQSRIAQEKTELANQNERIANTKSEEARVARDSAEANAQRARRNAEETKEALLALGQTTAQVAEALVAEANSLILRMNYPAAAEQLKSASTLNQPSPALRRAVQEVAFFWTEVGKRDRAAAFLRSTQRAAVPEARDALRAFLKKMDPGHYRDLQNRYFGEMVAIKGQTFKFGRNKAEGIEGQDATVSNFSIARTEATFWQYGLFCEALGRDIRAKAEPSWGYEGHDPIINVNWYDAVEYANWLSVLLDRSPAYLIDSLHRDTMNTDQFDDMKWTVRLVPGSNGYRLPTETEWDCAAKGGQDFVYSGSDSINEVAWYVKNGSRSYPVRTKKPNGYGLHDMSGNVWEWCWDWLGAYPTQLEKDYLGASGGALRLMRGGAWSSTAEFCYAGKRYYGRVPVNRYNRIGFRLVL